MSIFTAIEEEIKCEICHTRERKTGKKRCDYCESRYDNQGNAYIIASDIYKFFRKGVSVHVWVCDNKVNQIKKGCRMESIKDLKGKSKAFLMDYMRAKGYELQHVSHASL